MNENFKWIAAAVAVVGVTVGGILYLTSRKKGAPVDPPVATVPEPLPAAEEPAIQHPLPPAPTDEALPSLAESDPLVQRALTDLIGKEPFEHFIVPEELIRHIVVTVDNLPNEMVAERIRPLKRTPGHFVASGGDEAPMLDPANFERYKPVVQLVSTLDDKQLVAAYQRYYPLFQEAYASLGHPPQYFNDRVIEVIDHLLAAPEPQGPIALARPGLQYEYADPELESRSAGQKLLIRMGPENAAVLKARLRQLRSELAARPAGN